MVMNMLTPYWEKPFNLDRCFKLFSDPLQHEELWKELEQKLKLEPIGRVVGIWRIPYSNITEGILISENGVWVHMLINNPMDNIKFDINNKEEVIRWNSMKILSK